MWGKRMRKKIIGILVCTLLISINIIHFNEAFSKSVNNTIIVDDEGDGDYTKIQDAIDNAQIGDTIEVYSGIYYENILLNKQLNLIGINQEYISGSDSGLPFINGSNEGGIKSVLEIIEDNCTVSGFHLDKSNIAVIKIKSNYNIISSNQIIGIRSIDPFGINIEGTTGNFIMDNEIFGTNVGIYLNCSNRNIVENNLIEKNEYGIAVWNCTDNKVSRNKISYAIGPSIYLLNAIKNNVSSNHIELGNLAIVLWSSNENLFYNNSLFKNHIAFPLVESKYNLFYKNHIENNDVGVSNIYNGSDGNSFVLNNFIDNVIHAQDVNLNSWDNGKMGNYWDDYGEKYPDAKKLISKGVWDTPYAIDEGESVDRYPCININGTARLKFKNLLYSRNINNINEIIYHIMDLIDKKINQKNSIISWFLQRFFQRFHFMVKILNQIF
jgi:parallel beta-helix repeat protein